MGFHDRMRGMVIRQLALQPKGKGVPITLTKKTGGYNPKTGKTEPIVVTEFVSSGIRVNYKESNYNNSTIQYGDFQVYLSPVLSDGGETPRPNIGDAIKFLDTLVKVINISPFNDNGVGCGWKLQVRNG